MSNITPVDGFLTTDGTFFPNKEEAQARQHSLDLKKEIKEFLNIDDRISLTRFSELTAVMRWEEHKKLKELKQ